MFPARARALLPLAVALAVGVGGCGESPAETSAAAGPDKATVECRQEWRDLGEQVSGNDSLTQPSSLAARWRNISATLDYYATAAKAEDCENPLARQRGAIRALEFLSARLQPWDMELQLAVVQGPAQTYATSPRPPRPSPRPAEKGKKRVQQPRPPKPADIAAALETLTRQAPEATEQQGPGWQQAEVVELSDSAAVRKTVKDLEFLSEESRAFAICAKALKTIRAALGATGTPAG